MNANHKQQPQLIRSLLKPDVYDHPVTEIQLIETHISWVILTGDYAYKIKKPVDLGFLDFSTLEKRAFCCNEELRLNSRLAAPIYREVVPLAGTAAEPVLHGEGEIIEYAIKMVQFPQSAQLDNMLASGALEKHHMDAFARRIAAFHADADVAGNDSDYGDPSHVYRPVAENFTQIRQHLQSSKYDDQLAGLESWSEASFDSLRSLFEQRKRGGFIRECHGDMHLRNLVWFNDEPLAFDCLEFNADLRWIDTLSEIAFLVMDLQDRKQPVLAQRFLNSYLEYSGDYQGLRVFRFYLAYRALVRAKVVAIRAAQQGLSEKEQQATEHEFCAYLALAGSYMQSKSPRLIITRGMSASGKSTLTQPLLELIGAIRIRSDIERKRMFGIDRDTDSSAGIEQGIYSADAGKKTYQRLALLAESVLAAGYDIIVDAAFLKFEQRRIFSRLADRLKIPFVIVEFSASADTLRQRIRDRQGDVSDADLSVLEHQLATVKPLHDDEINKLIKVDTEQAFDADQLYQQIEILTRDDGC